MKTSEELYFELLEQIDLLSAKITGQCAEDISCKPGCSSCCIGGLSVFPIEAAIIKKSLRKLDISSGPFHDKCIFLREKQCTIYDLRPVVCRTQGLPLLYGLGENQPEISVCELNFTKNTSIDSSLLMDMDRINGILANINIIFADENGIEKKNAGERILLETLL